MLRAGHGLVLIVIALLTIGVLMVNSAGLTVRQNHTVLLEDVLLGRLTLLAGLAVLAMTIGAFLPVMWLYRARGWASPVLWIVLVSIALLLAVHLPGIGREVNGARRWIDLGPFSFQPSEVAKWGMLIVLAWYGVRHASEGGQFVRGFLVPMLPVAIVCGLIVTEDLGTAVLIGMVSVAMLVAGGAKLWHAAMLAPMGVAAVIGAIIHSPYRLDRVRAYLDPYADPQGIGYHMIQSMSSIAGGGLAGRGLGNSIQKFGYLPEDTTDFIFAIICEELGLAGAIVVIALYASLILLALSIIARVKHPFPRLLGLGITLTIALQAVINMAVVTGLAPTKGIALPLLSSGGTGWVLTAFSMGLLVSMDRACAREDEQLAEVDDSPGMAGASLAGQAA